MVFDTFSLLLALYRYFVKGMQACFAIRLQGITNLEKSIPTYLNVYFYVKRPLCTKNINLNVV